MEKVKFKVQQSKQRFVTCFYFPLKTTLPHSLTPSLHNITFHYLIFTRVPTYTNP